jgi:L-lactate dehydrogenase (cytochrome)
LRAGEIQRLVGLRRPRLGAVARLERCHDVPALKAAARRRIPRAVFDYVDGGADEEVTLARNCAAFHEWKLVPSNLRDVSAIDASIELLSAHCSLPLVLAPTGYTRMMHPQGELAVARAAGRAGLPYALSTVASSSIEQVATTEHPDLWFQLYIWRDRGKTYDLVARAWDAGYRVLEVSVDVPVAGRRLRDARNGLTIPPQLSGRALLDIGMHPAYWIAMLRGPALSFANAPPSVDGEGGLTIENMTAQFDPSVTWDDLADLRERWPGRMLVKGLIRPEEVPRVVAVGADGIHLSNHGGRQLDRVPATIELLPALREAAPEGLVIVLDSGVRNGTDIAVALALGADAAAVGRAYLYGLMAGGEAGVDRALHILSTELLRTMALLGVTTVDELRAVGPELLCRGSPPPV